MRGRGRRLRGQRVVGLRIQDPVADARDRPAVFVAPLARRVLEMRAGRMPVAHEDREARLVEDAGVFALQELVEPAHGLVAPLHAGPGIRLVRPGMVPGADRSPSPARSSRARACARCCRGSRRTSRRCERSGCGCRRSGRAARRGPSTARRAAAACARASRARCRSGSRKLASSIDVVRRAGARVVEVHAHFPGIEVHDPVHVMHVVLVEVLGRVDRDDRLERGHVPRRHLDRVEAAPGDAEHADVAVRPGLLRQPVDHDLAVRMLDVGVFVRDRAGPRCCPCRGCRRPRRHSRAARSTNRAASCGCEPRACGRAGTRAGPGTFLAGLATGRLVEVGGKADAVGHRDPGAPGFPCRRSRAFPSPPRPEAAVRKTQ